MEQKNSTLLFFLVDFEIYCIFPTLKKNLLVMLVNYCFHPYVYGM